MSDDAHKGPRATATIKVDAGGLEFTLPNDRPSVAIALSAMHHDVAEEMQATLDDLRAGHELLALAQGHRDKLMYEFKHWVGGQQDALSAADPKRAQWKILASIEGSGGYIDRRLSRAKADAAVMQVQGYVEGLRARLEVLRTLLALRSTHS